MIKKILVLIFTTYFSLGLLLFAEAKKPNANNNSTSKPKVTNTQSKPVQKKKEETKVESIKVVEDKKAILLMTDFSLKDGAVAAMKGVIFSLDEKLVVFDLTHDIPEYDIWQGSYRLHQVVNFWPKGTVFVSVVDPGVGGERKSIVAKAKNGQLFVNPNNGLLTLINDIIGIEEVRVIDETKNRMPNSYESYTFHGRDVYAYTGALLASNKIKFEDVGQILPLPELELINYKKAEKQDDGVIVGMVPVLDINYGNIWTNIPKSLFDTLSPKEGEVFNVKIYYNNEKLYDDNIKYVKTFGEVKIGEPLLYINSLLDVSFALNMDSFSAAYGIRSGASTVVEISRAINTDIAGTGSNLLE
jgi:S-adenosylmethionine hydrolase